MRLEEAVRAIGHTKGRPARASVLGLNSFRYDPEGGFIVGWEKWGDGHITELSWPGRDQCGC